MDKEFLEFMSSMSGQFKNNLNNYTDEELADMVNDIGIAETMTKIMSEGYESGVIDKIKTDLDRKSKNNRLSKDINEYINTKRANIIHDLGASLQVNSGDRMGINMEIVMASCDFGVSPKKKQLFVSKFQEEIQKGNDTTLGDFLMRTPDDYIKVLFYYLKINKIDDLRKFFNCFNENKKEILKTGLKTRAFDAKSYRDIDYNFHYETSLRAPTELFATMLSSYTLEFFLKEYNVGNIEDFNKMFLENHYMYSLILLVTPVLLKYFTSKNNINTTDKLIEFLKEEDIRKILIKTSKGGKIVIKNIISLFNKFNISNIEELKKIDDNLTIFITKISNKNLDILLRVFSCEKLDDFIEIYNNKYIVENIENSKYKYLDETFNLLEIEEDEKNKIIVDIISTYYNTEIGNSLKGLNKILEEFSGNLGNVGEFITKILSTSNNIEDNIEQLIELLSNLRDVLSQDNTSKYIDFGRLNDLTKFTGGSITSYLGLEILKSSNVELLLKEWSKIMNSFNDGKFDSKNELHKNLEYGNFKGLTKNKKIAKFMKSSFKFKDYLTLFDKKGLNYSKEDNYFGRSEKGYFSEQDKFELECVAYESSILKDYILDINKKALELGRRVLVIPNLSYGYLPVSAIVDELQNDNIDFLIGTKVGSTESHSNREVLNSSLFKGYRENIINNQPIIIIADGTNHLISRNGDGLGARYPDAYQGYLNQVIAMNYVYGNNDLEKMDYSDNGKGEYDISNLVNNSEFKKTVEIYKELLKEGGSKQYKFGLWNTANMDLIIRGGRKELTSIKPLSTDEVNGPTMIFCNIGVLDKQLPEYLKNDNFEHIPAYYDDSGKIIDFEYGFDNYGVKLVNNIEVELKKIVGGELTSVNKDVSAIIEYNNLKSVGSE